MYGGLFGDLPAAKGSAKDEPSSSSKEKNKKSSSSQDDGAGQQQSNNNKRQHPPQTAGKEKEDSSSRGGTKKSSPASSFLFPSQLASNKKAKVGVTSSISQAVGAAGTAVAFVPTTLRSRNKPKLAATTVTTTRTRHRFDVKPVESPTPVAQKISTSSSTAMQVSASSAPTLVETAKAPPSSSLQQKPLQEEPNFESHNRMMSTSSSVVPMVDIHQQTHDQHQMEQQQQQQQQQEEVEITDPYDPFVPNDLLQYWDRQALAQERATLERETRQALEKQRILREQLEKERQALQQHPNTHQQHPYQHHHPIISSTTTTNNNILSSSHPTMTPIPPTGAAVNTTLDGQPSHMAAATTTTAASLMMGMGRGRGRGVSNLPAWLVEKQRQEQMLGKAADNEGGGNADRANDHERSG